MPFAWERNQYKWDHFILPALQRFYDLNGHSDVPRHFRVPKGDSEWPENLWGQRLGFTVQNIRNRGDFPKQVRADSIELERLNLCHDSTLSDRAWHEKLLPALRTFREVFDHCDVSVDFTVPSSSPWPEAAWGMSLGTCVNSIRTKHLSVGRHASELEELGFVWNHFEYTHLPGAGGFPPTKLALPGTSFICGTIGRKIPSDERWPKLLWGLTLGRTVRGVRKRNDYSAQISRYRSRLDELGFVRDYREAEWIERVLPALKVFHQPNGHIRVPQGFIVPSDKIWPKQSWGLNLANVVRAIRNGSTYPAQISRDRLHLEELGFGWKSIHEEAWVVRILPALETFYRVHGHSRVPTAFVVPSEVAWPERTHGLTLGVAMSSFRRRGSYFDHVIQSIDSLEAINFDVKIPVAKWNERVEPLLVTFEQLHGHCAVLHDFVVHQALLGKRKTGVFP